MTTNSELMHTLLDGIVDIAYLMDTAGNLVYVNAAARDLGYEPEKMIGTSVFELIHADDRDKVVQSTGKRKKGITTPLLLNLRLLGADGQVVPFQMKSKLISIANGNGGSAASVDPLEKLSGDYILGTARDISDRKQLEEALEEVKASAAETAAGGDSNSLPGGPDRLPEMLLLPGRQETLSHEMAIAWVTSDYETEILKKKAFSLEDKIRLTLGCGESLYRGMVDDKKVTMEEMRQVTELANNLVKFAAYIKTLGGGVPELINSLIGHHYNIPEHSIRVGLYTALFSMELTPRVMMITRSQMVSACTGALLHDIGKVHLDPAIVRGGKKLNKEQLKSLMVHPAVGAKMIQAAGASLDVQQIVFQHHGVFSGPHGQTLSAKNFNPFAFVLAICNTFDNLTSVKPGIPTRKTYDSLVVMVKNMRGEVFAQMLKPFIKLIGERG